MRAGEARSSWGVATMQQVSDWLEKLGLGQYAPRFAENDISFAVLPDLTDQDLKEIGVSLGHRRQLVRAITELAGARKILLRLPLPPHGTPPSAARSPLCSSDLVGSTALSATLIVSDGAAIRNPSQFRQCSAHLQRSGRQLDLQHRTRRRRVVAAGTGRKFTHALHKVS